MDVARYPYWFVRSWESVVFIGMPVMIITDKFDFIPILPPDILNSM